MLNKNRLNIQLLVIILVLVMIPFISMGFSALQTVLNIEGDLIVSPPQDAIMGSYYKIYDKYLSDTYRPYIKYVTIDNHIDIPANAINAWDISADDTGKVMAYLVNNTVNSSMLDLHIQGEGKVMANENATAAFFNLSNVDTMTNFSLLDVSKTTIMYGMFSGTGDDVSIFTLDDISNWNVSNVTNMTYLFSHAARNATSFNIGDLSNWDVSNVEDMSLMFRNFGTNATTFNIGNLSNWNTSSATNMAQMFCLAGDTTTNFNIGDLSNWNTSNVRDMSQMFNSTGINSNTFNLNLSNWDTSNVADMTNMFATTGMNAATFSLGNLSNWNVSNVSDMKYMFFGAGTGATSFNIGNLSNWNTSKVTNMYAMFFEVGSNATTFDIGDLSNWKTSNVTSMGSMFQNTGSITTTFNLNLSNWDTSKVTSMYGMFYNTGSSATMWSIGNLSNWNVSNVIDMRYMFSYTGHDATTFDIGDLSNWNPVKANSMELLFFSAGYRASTFNIGNLSNWNVSNVTNMTTMFSDAGYNATTFNIGDISSWDVSNVTNMSSMFRNTGLNISTFNMNLSNWNTSKVTDMGEMFSRAGYNSTSFNLNLSNWKTSNVTSMDVMFSNAGYSATSFNINLSNFNTSKVTGMIAMFENTGQNATNFSIDLGNNFDMSNVTNSYKAFYSLGNKANNDYYLELSAGNFDNITNYASMFNKVSQTNAYIYVKDTASQNWIINKNSDWGTSFTVNNVIVRGSAPTNTISFVNRQNSGSITIGDEISISGEHFYVISSNSNKTVLLAKYNLLVGSIYDINSGSLTFIRAITSSDTGYGLQSSTALGITNYGGDERIIGSVPFSGTNYWDGTVCEYDPNNTVSCTGNWGLLSEYATGGASYDGNPYPNVYRSSMSSTAPQIGIDQSQGFGYAQNNGYTIAYYIEQYKDRLIGMGAPNTITARLLLYEELDGIGCSNGTCPSNRDWVMNTTYWLGSANADCAVGATVANTFYASDIFYSDSGAGARPVIEIDTSYLN